MTPAIPDSTVNANRLDNIVIEQAHLNSDPCNEQGSFPGEPGKENILGRHDDQGSLPVESESATESESFGDESAADDGDDDGEFVPRGGHNKPTMAAAPTKGGSNIAIKRADTPSGGNTANKDGAAGKKVTKNDQEKKKNTKAGK